MPPSPNIINHSEKKKKTKTMTSSMSTSSLYPFPPTSIAHNTVAIIDECEMAEMTPGNHTDAAIPIVEMAALLYMGEYVHARHLWRRHKDAIQDPSARASLEAWWGLGQAMWYYNFDEVWARLGLLKQQPQPYCKYAEVRSQH